jgi:TolB-like protein
MKRWLLLLLALVAAAPAARAADTYSEARDALIEGRDADVVKLLTPSAVARIRNHSHAALWLAIAQARSGHKSEALDGLKAYRAKSKESPFIDRIVDLYLGGAKEDAVLDSAKEPWQKCEAGFYLGAYQKFFEGNKDRAAELLKLSVDTQMTAFSEYRLAAVMLTESGTSEVAAKAPAEAPPPPPITGPVTVESALRADSLGNREEAIRLYRGLSREVKDPELASMVRSRIFTLSRELYEQRAHDALKQENTLSKESGPENSVAVARFENLSEDDQSAPLEKGIPAMLSSDMAQVRKLTILERVELEALLKELDLSHSALFDTTTAPRLGHLLRAGRVVVGSFQHTAKDKLDINARVVEVKSGRTEGNVHVSGKMRDFFSLEKDLVFGVMDRLGVRLTNTEKNTIERQVPTKDLAAFLAYAKGLDSEDRGDFRGAAEQYQAAVAKDGSFKEARAAAAGVSRGSVSYSDISKGLRVREAAPAPQVSAIKAAAGSAGDIVMERAFETERLTGSGLIPDIESGEAHDRSATRPATAGVGTVIVTGSLPR